MKSYKELYAIVEEKIRSQEYKGEPRELYEPVGYMLSLGGKRLRPVLVLMANDLFGGSVEDAIQAAIAVEVFHNFTLVHDDIMDNASIRRGKPTVHEKWGQPVAILSGDLMMIRAIDHLCETNISDLKTLITLFNKTAAEVCEGQQIDMNFESREDVSVEEYLHMITLKTAVLLGASLKIGALVAGAAVADADHIYEFGKNIGIAFQVQDDILDSFGEGAQVGKKIGGDIAANKKTLLLIEAMRLADDEGKQELTALMQLSDADTKIKGVLKLYEKLGVKRQAELVKQQYLQKAFDHLEAVRTEESRKNILRETAEELMQRIS